MEIRESRRGAVILIIYFVMDSVEKIARILRTDKHHIYSIEKRLAEITGKKGVFDRIAFENDVRIKDRLSRLGLSEDAHAKDVYDALIARVEANDAWLCESTGSKKCSVFQDFITVVDTAKKVMKIPKGYFIKLDRAAALLRHTPPKKILAFLGYATVEEMLAKEDIMEILPALRFVEGNEWLNKSFFIQYHDLTPDDFEERAVDVRVLSQRWEKFARIFALKKWHNVSHLKEFGIIFVIPTSLGISGEVLRMLSLVFHYSHEIPFYSDIFRSIAAHPKTFTTHLLSLLRGDVLDTRPPEGDAMQWLVIQRYLTKDDENDWRLFVPHINPEALHWHRAEDDLEASASSFGKWGRELSFWRDLDWVGDFFRDELGNNVVVSFDLVDTVMSLVKRHERVKFLYHHQEALWNRIFIAYFGEEKLEEYCKKHLITGYFEL